MRAHYDMQIKGIRLGNRQDDEFIIRLVPWGPDNDNGENPLFFMVSYLRWIFFIGVLIFKRLRLQGPNSSGLSRKLTSRSL